MILRVSNLSFSYKDNHVLKDINFKAYNNQIISLLGANGVGKTTLFNCLLNNLKDYKGSITYDGIDIKQIKAKELSKLIAYIPQSISSQYNYRVIDIVLMGLTSSLSLFSTPGVKHEKIALEKLDILGIKNLAYKGFNNLSGGEKQLVLISRALTQNAKILLMDEPTANLDYGNQIKVMNKLKSLSNEGYMIIFSTHNPEHAFFYSDKALALYKGSIECFGEPSKKLTKETLKKLYSIDVSILSLKTKENKTINICVPDNIKDFIFESNIN